MESPAELLGQLASTMNASDETLLAFLPTELIFCIITHLNPHDIVYCARVCKLFKDLCDTPSLWKSLYLMRWLPDADPEFVESAYKYNKNIEWRQMYQDRIMLEDKQKLFRPPLPSAKPPQSNHTRHPSGEMEVDGSSDGPSASSSVPTHEQNQGESKKPLWKEYFDNGNTLAQVQTEDLSEFILNATIEREQYISAAWFATQAYRRMVEKKEKNRSAKKRGRGSNASSNPYLNAGEPAINMEESAEEIQTPSASENDELASSASEQPSESDDDVIIDPKNVSDIYYFWGRSVKDVAVGCPSDDHKQKMVHLLDEEERYKKACQYDPSDAYVYYSWAINLRFQIEYAMDKREYELYKDSTQKYKHALQCGYTAKFIQWGLGSLKLHMARKMVIRGKHSEAAGFLDKAERKYKHLQSLCNEHDLLTSFSLSFNYSCIFSTRSKIHREFEQSAQSEEMLAQCKEKLQHCAQGEFKQFLTLDLLDLWYFDEFRKQDWFVDIYTNSEPKKLSASY